MVELTHPDCKPVGSCTNQADLHQPTQTAQVKPGPAPGSTYRYYYKIDVLEK